MATDLEELMAKMPKVGNIGVPEDLGLGVESTLSVPNMEVPTGDPSLSRANRFFQETIPNAVGGINDFFSPLDTMASNYGQRAEAGRASQVAGATEAFRGLGAAKDVLFKEGSPSLGEAFEARGGRVDAQLPQPEVPSVFSAQPPVGQVPSANIGQLPTTPAPFSTEGAAQVNPMMAAQDLSQIQPAPQAPTSGGTITGPNGVVNTFEPQAPTQASMDAVAARQAGIDANAAANAQAGLPIGYGPTTRANVAAGRPANVSAGEVQVAQRQALQREAEATADRAAEAFRNEVGYVGGNGRSIGQTDDAVAQVRAAALSEAMGKIDPNATGGADSQGLTVDQQLKIDQMNYDRAQDKKKEASAAQEVQAQDQSIYDMYNDNFERQERYIEQSLKNTGAMSTGFASLAKILPGTKARDLEESLKPILGEAAFGRLQQMRDASKTGGALGAISKNELDLLEAAMGALSTSQNEAQFRSNLLSYRKQLRESNARIQAAYEGKYKQGSGTRSAPRHKNDQDFGEKVNTYFQG